MFHNTTFTYWTTQPKHLNTPDHYRWAPTPQPSHDSTEDEARSRRLSGNSYNNDSMVRFVAAYHQKS